ncbi:MAG: di-heme oxidoredictase family protein [Hyphomicrobiaceae bacterium]
MSRIDAQAEAGLDQLLPPRGMTGHRIAMAVIAGCLVLAAHTPAFAGEPAAPPPASEKLHAKLPPAVEGLGSATKFSYVLGGVVFNKLWVSAPSSTTSSDGLGPLFNARSCAQCHPGSGQGRLDVEGAPKQTGAALIMRLSVPGHAAGVSGMPDPNYGRQIQPFAIQGLRGEGSIQRFLLERRVTLSGGETATLSLPDYRLLDLGYGPLDRRVMKSPRLAPALFGAGLLAAIPDADIIAEAARQQATSGPVKGKAARLHGPAGGGAVGRFGWKASHATLAGQVAEALSLDMGLSSSRMPEASGDCTPAQTACRAAPAGAPVGQVEVEDAVFSLLMDYVANVAPPAQAADADADALAIGRDAFRSLGCGTCHRERYTIRLTGKAANGAMRDIRPFTDLLLHDMGDLLADARPEGAANGRQWRTPPLWGLMHRAGKGQQPRFLHDGRAAGLAEAVLWHGGEAQSARDAFAALSPDTRAALLRYLGAL